MATTSEVESACSLSAWQGDDNRLEKTFNFDDFSAAARLVGDHRHPVGRAGPWSPRGTLAGARPRPIGQVGP